MAIRKLISRREFTEERFEELYIRKLFLILKTHLVNLIPIKFLRKKVLLRLSGGGTTMAMTDYNRIYLRKLPFTDLTVKVLVVLYIHEIMHIILKHRERAWDLHVTEKDMDTILFNIAADHVINTYIEKLAASDLFLDAAFTTKFLNTCGVWAMEDFDRKEYPDGPTEVVYRMLKKKKEELKKKMQQQFGGGSCSGDPNGSGKSNSDNNQDDTELTEGDHEGESDIKDDDAKKEHTLMEQLKKDMKVSDLTKDIIEKANAGKPSPLDKEITEIIDNTPILETLSDALGDVGLGLRREFENAGVNKRMLDKIFFNSFENKIKGEDDRTYIPYDVAISQMYKAQTGKALLIPTDIIYKPEAIGFAIDTSGSINLEELSRYLSSCVYLIQKHKVDVRLIICDAKIHEDVFLKYDTIGTKLNGKYLKQFVKGGGGTNMTLPMAEFEKDKRIKTYMVFTDGMTPWPAIVKKRVYLLIYEVHKDSVGRTPAYGKVLYV